MKISKAAEEGGRSRRMGRGHGVAQCACTSIHYNTGRRFTAGACCGQRVRPE